MTEQIAVAGGAVTFSELVGVPQLSRTTNANKETRTEVRHGIIAWANLELLLLECFPLAPALSGTHPSISFLYVAEVDIRPWPDTPAQSDLQCLTTNVNYTWAIATIKYTTLPYDPNDLIKRRATVSVEVMLQPANGVVWEDTGDRPEQEDLMSGKQIPMTDWDFSFFEVPPAKEAVLDQTVRDLIGKVNDGLFEDKTDETLLFRGYEKEWTIDSNGDQRFTYGYQFSERIVKAGALEFGWNHFYRNKDGIWARLKDKQGNFTYPKTADFGDLFV